jgi:hypothetical protein
LRAPEVPHPEHRREWHLRRIFISDPDDGDATFLLFELKFKRLRLTHTAVELEIVHPHEAESMLWLRRRPAELPQ